jgi:hypothetical protein
MVRGGRGHCTPKMRLIVCTVLLLTILIIVVIPEIDLRPTTLRVAASYLLHLGIAGMAIISCSSLSICFRRSVHYGAESVAPPSSGLCDICVRRC